MMQKQEEAPIQVYISSLIQEHGDLTLLADNAQPLPENMKRAQRRRYIGATGAMPKRANRWGNASPCELSCDGMVRHEVIQLSHHLSEVSPGGRWGSTVAIDNCVKSPTPPERKGERLSTHGRNSKTINARLPGQLCGLPY
eukprot:Nitzschia sp. Nitz4//scaffold117_size69655//51475//51897//NITZ4_006026-RA/size69655-processed-gene-0.106-mRNA-1//-1//CDS//3329533657//7329//frame0